MTKPEELVEKVAKRVLKEWKKYDRLNCQMDSETEAALLSRICIVEVLSEIQMGEVATAYDNQPKDIKTD